MLRWTKIRWKCLLRDILNYQMSWNIEKERVEHICNWERFWPNRVIMIQVRSTSIEPWKSLKKLMILIWRSKPKLISVWPTLLLNGIVISPQSYSKLKTSMMRLMHKIIKQKTQRRSMKQLNTKKMITDDYK